MRNLSLVGLAVGIAAGVGGPWAPAAVAQVASFTGTYAQDFNQLRDVGRGTFNTNNPSLANAPFTLVSPNTLGGWSIHHSSANDPTDPNNVNNSLNDYIFEANDGTRFQGRAYSYGADASTERAIGTLQTSGNGSPTPKVGLLVSNDTGTALPAVTVTYTGEQWRLGNRFTPDTGLDRLDFAYKLGAATITESGFTDVDALDFITPDPTGTLGARDGNAAGFRTTLTQTITFGGTGWEPGQVLAVRWQDFFFQDGANDALAVDDFRIEVAPVPEPGSVLLAGGLAAGAVAGVRRFRK